MLVLTVKYFDNCGIELVS